MIADSLSISAESLLLGQLLFPFAAAVAIPVGFSSPRRCSAVTQCGLWLMGILSVSLVAHCLGDAVTGSPLRVTESITIEWTLWGSGSESALFDRIVMRMDATRAALLALMPWTALTVLSLLGPNVTRSQCVATWLLMGATGVFLLAGDIASLMIGWSLMIGVLSWWVAWFGSEGKRDSAKRLLGIQVVSLGVFAAGLAVMCGIDAIVQGAPDGPPGVTSTVWTELPAIREALFETHPAAPVLWRAYHTLPAALLLIGTWLAAGLFPVAVWTYDRNLLGRSPGRAWMIVLLPIVLIQLWLILVELDPLFEQETRGILSWFVVVGATIAGARMAIASDPEERTLAGFAWLRHLVVLALLGLPGEMWDTKRVPLLVSLIAAGALWGLLLPGNSALSGTSGTGRRLFAAAWAILLYAVGMLPGLTGMVLLWAATHPRGLAGQPGGEFLLFLLLIANCLATWGTLQAVLQKFDTESGESRSSSPHEEGVLARPEFGPLSTAPSVEPSSSMTRTQAILCIFWMTLPPAMAVALAGLW